MIAALEAIRTRLVAFVEQHIPEPEVFPTPRWEWQSAGGRTFIVYADDIDEACERMARAGWGPESSQQPRLLPPIIVEGYAADIGQVIDERRAPGA